MLPVLLLLVSCVDVWMRVWMRVVIVVACALLVVVLFFVVVCCVLLCAMWQHNIHRVAGRLPRWGQGQPEWNAAKTWLIEQTRKKHNSWKPTHTEQRTQRERRDTQRNAQVFVCVVVCLRVFNVFVSVAYRCWSPDTASWGNTCVCSEFEQTRKSDTTQHSDVKSVCCDVLFEQTDNKFRHNTRSQHNQRISKAELEFYLHLWGWHNGGEQTDAQEAIFHVWLHLLHCQKRIRTIMNEHQLKTWDRTFTPRDKHGIRTRDFGNLMRNKSRLS